MGYSLLLVSFYTSHAKSPLVKKGEPECREGPKDYDKDIAE